VHGDVCDESLPVALKCETDHGSCTAVKCDEGNEGVARDEIRRWNTFRTDQLNDHTDLCRILCVGEECARKLGKNSLIFASNWKRK
jgi:hypothetical protein